MPRRFHRPSRALATIVLALAAGSASQTDAAFSLTGLGPVSGGTGALGYGISANGAVQVGWTTTGSASRATRWSGGVGTDLGANYGNTNIAFAASGDGATVVGYGQQASAAPRAFRWTAAQGVQDLGNLAGGTGAAATNVNHDGSVIVGHGSDAAGQNRAIRWVNGSASDLGLLGGSTGASQAWDVSADGGTVVGFATNAAGASRAFRWTESGGMLQLGSLGVSSQARGVSGDGAVAVGFFANADNSFNAFRWTAAGGMSSLGTLGGAMSIARATNFDGSVVVGSSTIAANSSRAFIWTQGSGMVELAGLLGAQGVDLTGWTLEEALSISADGSTIVGRGTFNGQMRGFVAVVPAPAVLPALATAIGLRRRRR